MQCYKFDTNSMMRKRKKKHVTATPKLQALVYDIFSSTTAVFSYAIGSKKLSANEQFLAGAQTVVSLVTNNSNYITHLFYN